MRSTRSPRSPAPPLDRRAGRLSSPLPPGRDAGTRARLLEAAARTFAQRGFRDATVREVCRAASANVAAVNYHFGSKERLYLETLRSALSLCETEMGDLTKASPPGNRAEARARLRAFVRFFATRLLGTGREWHTRLVQREMLEPTFALDAVVREFMAPRFRALQEALAPFLPGADERTLALHAMSVHGQILYYRCAAPVALRLLGERGYSPALIEEIAEHVACFTERAIASGKKTGRSAP